jgi:hypothetical protein
MNVYPMTKRWLFPAALMLACLAGMPTGSPAAQAKGAPSAQSEVSGEIAFPESRRYVILQHKRDRTRLLAATGEALTPPKKTANAWVIERIDRQALALRSVSQSRLATVRRGATIPGQVDLVFVDTVMVKKLQYRSKLVNRLTRQVPILVSLEGTTAVLETEVLRSSSGPKVPVPELSIVSIRSLPSNPAGSPTDPGATSRLTPEMIDTVPVKEVAPDTYELDAPSAMAILGTVGQALEQFSPTVAPAFSVQTGMTLNVHSAVGEGTLSRKGFTVTNLKVAQTFGIEVGDTIVSINGYAVNSPLNAWWTYQEIVVRNQPATEVRVDLIRNGSLVTKNYSLR